MIGHSLIDIVRSKTGTRLLDPALAFSISNFSVSFHNKKSLKYIAPISPRARVRPQKKCLQLFSRLNYKLQSSSLPFSSLPYFLPYFADCVALLSKYTSIFVEFPPLSTGRGEIVIRIVKEVRGGWLHDCFLFMRAATPIFSGNVLRMYRYPGCVN